MRYARTMTTQDDSGEIIYRWTIRGLYVIAIGLNVWMLWDQVRETPEGAELQARASRLADLVTRPIRERTHFRRAANRVIYEAMEVVASDEGDD